MDESNNRIFHLMNENNVTYQNTLSENVDAKLNSYKEIADNKALGLDVDMTAIKK